MKEDPHYPSIDSELEARIVALVLGEASDFERDKLNRLIEERPELAAFKDEMQNLHGLLRDVGTGESVAEDDDWKLSAEKRNAVLAVISGEAKEQPAIQLAGKPAGQQRSEKWSLLRNIAKVAAVFLVAGFLGSLAIVPSVNSARESARRRVTSSEMPALHLDSGAFMGEASAPASKDFMADGAVEMELDEEYVRAAEATTIAEPGYVKSALLAIRESLGADAPQPSPRYLMDDAQDLPAMPELNLRQEATASGESGLLRRVQEQRRAAEGRLRAEVKAQLRSAERSHRKDPSGEASAAEQQMRAPTPGVNGPGPGLSRQTADDLALIPQGVESSGAAASKDAVSWQDSSSFYSGLRDGESASGETEDTSKRMAGLGMVDRPVVEGKSESSPELAMPALGSQESGQSQSNRKADVVISGLPKRTGRIALGGAVNSDAGVTDAKPSAEESSQGLAGGTNLRFSRDFLGDSPVAGKEMEIDGVARDGEGQEGEGQAGERFRVDWMAAADAPGNEAERMPEEIVERELGRSLSAGELSKTAPPKPIVAGGSGRKREADKPSDHDLFFDSGIPVPSIPSPTSQPMSSSEDLKTKETYNATEDSKEEFAKERLGLRKSRLLQGMPNGRQIPVPVTGTAIGLPDGELQVGQANQDQRWGYGAQPKTPQGGPAGRKKHNYDALPEDYRYRVETYGERIPSKQKHKGVELPGQRDQLAGNEPSRRYWYVPPMLEDNSESIKKKQATSDAWATRINREWLEKLPRPRHESEPMRTAPAKRYVAPAGLNEKTAEDEAFSTFSLHVSDVSFKLARAALASGQWPEAAKVRIEEFVNAFDYGDPMPSQSERVACRVEQSVHPFLQQRNLLRVSMQTAAAGRASNTPLRLTFLLDNSGSMERVDRQQTVRRAFALLAQQLKPIDQVTLISFARQPRLLADNVSGAESHQLVGLIQNLPSEGGTNIEAALQLGFEKAQEQRVDNAQNRIILLTDGAVNLGDADPESLSQIIATMRGAGIAFDAAGISAEGLNDEILEALTRKGDGRYYLLDSLEAADEGFARQIAGALRPSAKNVKVQIEFNPKRVGRYKLLGFEKHRLNQEDFRNDKVDAAEMAAAEAGVAVYQFEAKADGEGDVGSVSVRFRDVSTQQMIENCWPIPYQPDAPRVDQAAPSLRIATSAALLAAKLRGDALGETVDLKTLSNLIAGLPDQDRNANRVGQLQLMIGQARQVSGK